MRKEFVARLQEFNFGYAITLGVNHRQLPVATMRDRLKAWDAKMNRFLNGSSWMKRTDERILWVALLEKSEVNPHWHLVASPDPHGFKDTRASRYRAFGPQAQLIWRNLEPKGTYHCDELVGSDWEWYITKELGTAVGIEEFVIAREFWSAKESLI